MPYELISDGKQVPLGDKRYLFSPQDLAGLEVLPELDARRRGFAENRRPAQSAGICRQHHAGLSRRRWIIYDLRMTIHAPQIDATRQSQIVNRKYEMEMAFSRGLYTGWFGGINNQELVHARFGKKRGVYLGEVARVQRRTASR